MNKKSQSKLDSKSHVYSLRLEERDVLYFDYIRTALLKKTGMPVSRTWIITELIRLGFPAFEKKFKLKRPGDLELLG